MRYRLSVALAALLVVAACSDDSSEGEGAEGVGGDAGASRSELFVRPGRADWSTGYFQAALYSGLLEELGYEVTSPADNEYPPAEAYQAMALGKFDFWPNGWFTQHETWWFPSELADGSTVGDHMVILGDEISDGSLEGLIITKSVADEHGIVSLDQINADAELAALFDSDGNGMAEVRGCPEDWTCGNLIDEMIELNGWSNVEQVRAGWDGMVAASIEQLQAGEAIIQYLWSPSGYLTEIVPGENAYWLSLGGEQNVLDGSTESGTDFARFGPSTLGTDCTADPCWTGWEVADIRVAARREFADANPAAVALFEVVEITIADVVEQNVRMLAGENTEADIERHAEEWISANRKLVDGWLSTARAALDG